MGKETRVRPIEYRTQRRKSPVLPHCSKDENGGKSARQATPLAPAGCPCSGAPLPWCSKSCGCLQPADRSPTGSCIFEMVGLPGFEPGSRDPQPRSIGQANLQALWASLTSREVVKALSDSHCSLAMLKGAISSTKSMCPTNILLQQYLSMPRSSNTLSESPPVSTASLYCS